ncbi:MAG: mercury methylation ferredoxin HgcB [Thermoleophilia bacterium]
MSSGLVYLRGVATLTFDRAACTGCGMCLTVCPHAVFAPVTRAVEIRDIDRCIECGACARNCPEGAITVDPGTGCAIAILKGWLSRRPQAPRGSSAGECGAGGGPVLGPGGHAPAAGGKPC